MSALSDYDRYDALGLAELVAKGDVTPAELLDEAIRRTEAIDPKINAVVMRHFDEARAAIRAGLPDGPFKGVPYLLKNLGPQLAGTVTDNSCRLFDGAAATHDSTLTARYKAAGLTIFGKTNTPEFGLTTSTEPAMYGVTRNPWDLTRSAGGSSGGAAAAVAAGIVPMANASDGGGSIRIPAAACGLFGLKPTRARTPSGPDRGEGWDGMSISHVISRTVRDSAALLDATHGPEPGDPYAAPPGGGFLDSTVRDPQPLRIGVVLETPPGSPLDPDLRAGVEATAKLLEDLGHHVEDASLGIDYTVLRAAQGAIICASTAHTISLRETVLGRKAREDELERGTAAMVENGRRLSAEDYARASHVMHQLGRTLGAFHQRYDILLQPTTASLPPKLGVLTLSREDAGNYLADLFAFTPYNALHNMTGQPSASVPVHWTADGFPVGTMLSAAVGADNLLYAVCGQLERAAPWAHRRPTL